MLSSFWQRRLYQLLRHPSSWVLPVGRFEVITQSTAIRFPIVENEVMLCVLYDRLDQPGMKFVTSMDAART